MRKPQRSARARRTGDEHIVPVMLLPHHLQPLSVAEALRPDGVPVVIRRTGSPERTGCSSPLCRQGGVDTAANVFQQKPVRAVDLGLNGVAGNDAGKPCQHSRDQRKQQAGQNPAPRQSPPSALSGKTRWNAAQYGLPRSSINQSLPAPGSHPSGPQHIKISSLLHKIFDSSRNAGRVQSIMGQEGRIRA